MSRNTGRQKRNRAIIRARRDDCALCGQPIDYNLKYPDLMSFTLDHIIPLKRGGRDTLDNGQAAHFKCNRAKSAGPDPDKVIRRSGSVVIPDHLG